MKDIAVYGAGGFGREVACLIKKINDTSAEPIWNFIGYFDDGKPKGAKWQYGDILGGRADVNSWDKPLSVAIAIGSPNTMKKIVSNIVNPNIDFPNLISPIVEYIDKNSHKMGRGNIVCSGCLFSCCTTVGDFNIFNNYVAVGHDSTIGDFNSFMPGVRISGEVTIGNNNFWGVNSSILQQKTVGDNVTVGAGSVIIRKPKDGNLYMGVPASLIRLH